MFEIKQLSPQAKLRWGIATDLLIVAVSVLALMVNAYRAGRGLRVSDLLVLGWIVILGIGLHSLVRKALQSLPGKPPVEPPVDPK